MNKFLVIMLVALMAIPTLNSCTKKGEEDPGLSLKSRKSRLAGEWTLTSGSAMMTFGGNTYSVTFSSGMATYTYMGTSTTVMYSETVTYEKDNTFKATVIDDGDMTVTEGFWAFMGAYDEVKKEECVVTRTKSRMSPGGVTMYTGEEMPTSVFRFKRLSSKDAIIILDGTEVDDGDLWSVTGELTYTKK